MIPLVEQLLQLGLDRHRLKKINVRPSGISFRINTEGRFRCRTYYTDDLSPDLSQIPTPDSGPQHHPVYPGVNARLCLSQNMSPLEMPECLRILPGRGQPLGQGDLFIDMLQQTP